MAGAACPVEEKAGAVSGRAEFVSVDIVVRIEIGRGAMAVPGDVEGEGIPADDPTVSSAGVTGASIGATVPGNAATGLRTCSMEVLKVSNAEVDGAMTAAD
jgi:hypothetical protein